MEFRKKPVVIEAFRLGLDNIPDWFMDRVTSYDIVLHGERKDLRSADIKTLEGVMRGEKGDYIIRGVKGEIYPCKADIFSATYEPVGDSPESVEPVEISHLTAERDRALKTRDLAQEASTRDLEAKRAAEDNLARVTEARDSYRTGSQNHMRRCDQKDAEIARLRSRVSDLESGSPEF